MTLRIELSEEQAAALSAQARAQGLTVEQWLQRIAASHVEASSIAHLQKSDPAEWARRFRVWADSHDPDMPVLSSEAMNRESIYPDCA